MRNWIKHSLALIIGALSICSCSEDSGADAKISYYITCDSIVYADPLNAQHDSIIVDALGYKGLQLTGIECYFIESASVKQNSIPLAQATCNEQAKITYDKKLSTLNREDIEYNTYKLNKEALNAEGITSASDLNLGKMTIYTTLWLLPFETSKVMLDRKSFTVE